MNKILFRSGPRYVELGAEIRNALQETDIDTLVTQVFVESQLRRGQCLRDSAPTDVPGAGVFLRRVPLGARDPDGRGHRAAPLLCTRTDPAEVGDVRLFG